METNERCEPFTPRYAFVASYAFCGEVENDDSSRDRPWRSALPVVAHEIPLVIAIYSPPVEALLETKALPGYQSEPTSWGARVFNLPRPYMKSELAEEIMATLRLP